MQWTIGKKLYTAVAVLGLVVVGLTAVGNYGITSVKEDLDQVTLKTAPNIGRATHLDAVVTAYLATNRLNVIRAAQKDAAGIEKNLREMEALVADFKKTASDLEQNTAVEAIKVGAREATALMEEFAAVISATTSKLATEFRAEEAAVSLTAAAAHRDKLTAKIDDLGKAQNARLEAVTVESAASAQFANMVLLVAAVLGFVSLVAVVFIVRTTIKVLTATVNNLKSGSEQVTSAATQVAASAQDLSSGSTEQAASLEETSASMEEMASMTRKNAENSQQAAQLMTEVDRVVEGSNKALTDMTHSMTSIRESSNKVSKIIKTIDEIAFQTNILALNAAVEAARAGEAGMGFAVVADEVRNLAQRSAQAAKDTAALIEESIANSQEGNAKVEIVAQSIAAITGSVAKVKGLVTEVSEASRQQSQGIDQVAQAVAQMEKVTQSTAASAEESAAASEELSAQAETTMAEVGLLETMVIGSRGGVAVQRAPARAAAAARPADRSARLLKLPTRSKATPPPPVTAAEGEIPLGDTGTYGKF